MKHVLFCMLFATGICCAGAARAQAPTPAAAEPATETPQELHASKLPFELVRSMHALQDQMVFGNYAAQAALPKLSSRIAERMLAAPPQSWHDARNARAVVSYVFGGGQVRVARKVLESGSPPDFERKLLEGAVAYAEGHQAKARQMLMDIDPRKLSGPLAGHLAFIQAELTPKEEAAKAKHLLDMARLLSPGTLVEEAALRREIVFVDDLKDIDDFVLLAGQYERRFKSSVYADNFRQRFAASLLRLELLSDVEHFARLDTLLSDVPAEERLNIYLLISQAAVVSGNLPVARVAARRAAGLSKPASVESARIAVYDGAATVLTTDYDKGLADLKSIDLSRLPKRDAALARSVLALAQRMHEWPDSADEPDGDSASPTPVRTSTPVAKADAVIDLAQKALSETDGLLSQ